MLIEMLSEGGSPDLLPARLKPNPVGRVSLVNGRHFVCACLGLNILILPINLTFFQANDLVTTDSAYELSDDKPPHPRAYSLGTDHLHNQRPSGR